MSMVAPSNLFYIVNDKFRVIVRLTPKASQNSIVSLAHETDGSARYQNFSHRYT